MVGNERVVRGFYSYIGDDGKPYTVNYIADRNGYRATGSHLPVQPLAVQPLQQYPQENIGYPSSTPLPYVPPQSSYAPPFVTSTPAPIYVPSSTPYNRPGHLYIPSSTFAPSYPSSTAAPFASSTSSSFYPSNQPSYVSGSFPGYQQRPSNTAYLPPSVSQSVAPIFYSPSSTTTSRPITRFSFAARQPNGDDVPRITSTLAPPLLNEPIIFNGPSSTIGPYTNNDQLSVRNQYISPNNQYIPPGNQYIPPPIVSSTPRPFSNNVASIYQQPTSDTVYITPKPFYSQQRNSLPNSISINQELLPPYLAVNGLDSIDNNYRRNDAGDYRVEGPRVRPLTVTNFNYNNK